MVTKRVLDMAEMDHGREEAMAHAMDEHETAIVESREASKPAMERAMSDDISEAEGVKAAGEVHDQWEVQTAERAKADAAAEAAGEAYDKEQNQSS